MPVLFIKTLIGDKVNRLSGAIFATIGLILVLGVWAPPGSCRDAAPIRLAAFEYPPFFTKKNNKVSGIGADLGRALFRRLHLETTLTIYPLKRALIYLRNGTIDGTMILVKTKDREAFLSYSVPVVQASGYIWSAADRRGGPVYYESLEDLMPYRIGVTIGYSYGQTMDQFLDTANTDSAPEEYQSFVKLMTHRVDIVPATDIIAKSLIKTHPEFQGKFIRSDNAFLHANYYMGISKESRLAELMPRINQVITEMRNTGVIDAIVKAYTE